MKTVQSKNFDRRTAEIYNAHLTRNHTSVQYTVYNINVVFYDFSPTNPDKLANICATSWRSVTASGFFTSGSGVETGVKPETGWLETGSWPSEVDEEDMTDVDLDWLCDWFTGVICNEDPPGLIRTKIKRCPWRVYRIMSVQIKDLYFMITDYYNQNSDILNLLFRDINLDQKLLNTRNFKFKSQPKFDMFKKTYKPP